MTILNDIIAGNLDEFDKLPVSAKVFLCTRLLRSIDTDFNGIRSRLFHDSGADADLPRLRQNYTEGRPIMPSLNLPPSPGPRDMTGPMPRPQP